MTDNPLAKQEIDALVSPLTSAYEFYELIFIDRIQNREKSAAIIEAIPNSRFLWVDNTEDHYSMRAIAASEAIGDRIIITSIPDLRTIDVFKYLIEDSQEDIVFFRYKPRLGSVIFRSISSFSQYKIDPAFSDTILIRQASMHKLQRLPETRLAFRFPHNSNQNDTSINKLPQGTPSFRNFKRRFSLLMDIVFSSLKTIFICLNVLSCFSGLIGVSYFIYAVFIYTSGIDVQPGWFSTSVVMSFFIFVLSLFIFCCSALFLYFVDVIIRTSTFSYNLVAMDENLKLFSKLESEANVVV